MQDIISYSGERRFTVYLVSEIIEIEAQPYANNIRLGKSLLAHTTSRNTVLDIVKNTFDDNESLSIIKLTSENMHDVLSSVCDNEEALKTILNVAKHCVWRADCEEDFQPKELEPVLSHMDVNEARYRALQLLHSMELKEETRNKTSKTLDLADELIENINNATEILSECDSFLDRCIRRH